jgi:hypothetical protein
MESTKRGTRLGTQLRGRLAHAYDRRGHARKSLWYVYSAIRKADVVLASDLEFGHFLFVESDPSVLAVDYAPQVRVQSIAGSAVALIVDAEVTRRQGVVEWRELCFSEHINAQLDARRTLDCLLQARTPGLEGVERRVATELEVFARPMWIRNWMRALPWIAQARHTPLDQYQFEVATTLNARREVELSDVLELGDGQERALYCAAALEGVRDGSFESDLGDAPLSRCTRLWVGESR